MTWRLKNRMVRVALLGEDDVKEQEENAEIAELLPGLIEENERLKRESQTALGRETDLGEELMMRTYAHV